MQGNPLRTLRRHRDFRRFFFAGLVSDVGTHMQAVTVAVLVASTSGSAGATALVMSALFFPQSILAPIGGLLADRFDRRKLAIVVLVSQTVLAGFLALLIHRGVHSALPLTGVILVQGCANALLAPAFQAMVPSLVPREELFGAIALFSVSWNGGRILGPALAAVSTSVWGPSATILANAVSFAVLALVLLTVRRPMRGGGDVVLRRWFRELKAGVKASMHVPGPRLMIALVVLMQMTVSSFVPVIAVIARQLLGGDTSTATWMFAVYGLGALFAAFTTTWLAPIAGRSLVLRVWMLGAAIGVFITGNLHSVAPAVPVVFFTGGCITAVFVVAGSIVQRDAIEEQRGRFVAVQSAVVGFCYGVGSIMNGFIADHTWGLRTHLMVCGGLLAAATLLAWWRRPHWLTVIDGHDEIRLRLRAASEVESRVREPVVSGARASAGARRSRRARPSRRGRRSTAPTRGGLH